MTDTLVKILGACKFPDTCVCLIKQVFETVQDELFFVFDEGGISKRPVQIVSSTDQYQLTVQNPSHKVITMGKLDNCVIDGTHSKCDCILFSDDYFYLIEIKSSSAGTRGKKRQKAYSQLDATISFLRDKQVPLDWTKTSAVICFKSMEPKITNSANNSARAKFLEDHQILLEEKNVITFV